MLESALREEAYSLFSRMSPSKMFTVIQFARFVAQQPEENIEFMFSPGKTHDAASREARDRHDVEWINANAERLNAEVEETLEFQADWRDEE
jgi:hypothetical protein